MLELVVRLLSSFLAELQQLIVKLQVVTIELASYGKEPRSIPVDSLLNRTLLVTCSNVAELQSRRILIFGRKAVK